MSKRPRVLIIDDNVEFAENIQEILEAEGLDAELAADGPSGLERIAASAPDLVITDMRMPGMNGLEVIRFMKEKRPALPVIVISAYARDELLEEAEREGALEILSKPVDMDHLSRFVARVAGTADKVLVVEDDDQLRVNLCSVLQDVGHVVPVTARSLLQAERLLDNRSIKAAIIDLRLPDGDGIELGRRLRERLGDQVPVVFITGYARDFRENLEQVLALTGVHLLEKPFPTPSFLALVKAALASARERAGER